MSRPSTSFNGSATDQFLPSMHQEQQLSQADFDLLFGSGASGQAEFSSNNSEVLDTFDYTYDNASLSHVNSANTSAISTPDFSSYSFGQQSPAYPTPGPNSPHPYPLDLQHVYHTNASRQDFDHRPLPNRSNTNNTFARPTPPPQQYSRRRSLSHSDVDRVAVTNCIPNPTFIRLQAPRARTSTPEEKRRSSPYPQNGRSASQGPNANTRGRPMKPKNTPYALQSSPLVDGMLPTPIGTPLNELMEVEDLRNSTNSANFSRQTNQSRQYDKFEGPVIRHMQRPEELARSRQIIEIGAMAVTKLDPRLEEQMSHDSYARILRKLEDIEMHLHYLDGDAEDALRGCAMIREALDKRTQGVQDGKYHAPSKVLHDGGCGMYGEDDGDDALMMVLKGE